MLRRIRAGHQANCRLTVYLQILGPNDKQMLFLPLAHSFAKVLEVVFITPSFDEASPDLADPPPPAPRTFTTTGGRVVRAAPASAAPE